MKGNSNLKQATVFLMAFVLVVGLAGAGGLVYGQTEETSDVSVTVSEDTIEVDNVTYTDGSGTDRYIITDNTTGTDFGFNEGDPAATDTGVNFSVQVTVYSSDLDNVSSASINIYAANQDLGDALGEEGETGFFYKLWENDDDEGDPVWDGESETLTANFTTSDNDTFLRYGDWEIYAEIESNGTTLDSETFTNALFAEEYTVFSGPADFSATIDPGQSVGINTAADVNFTVGTGGTGTANVSIVTNYNWSLAISDTTLTSADSPDEIPAETAQYSNEGGSPTTEITPDVELLYTATEVRPVTYDTTITHTLTNEDTST